MSEDFTPESPLEAVADALIEAHRHAVLDGDAKLLGQIEAALLYVGCRLAAKAAVHDETVSRN